MVEHRRGTRFVEESIDELFRDLRAQHLHGGFATEQRVLGAIDDTHATFPDQRRDPVVAQGLVDHSRGSYLTKARCSLRSNELLPSDVRYECRYPRCRTAAWLR